MIRFAAFTDLHYDIAYGGEQRLRDFLTAIQSGQLDFIISLGDFCYPLNENRHMLDLLHTAHAPVYFTVGNHDSVFPSQEILKEFWHTDSLHYSFTIENTKFIVLNSCYMKQNHIFRTYYLKEYNKQTDQYPVVPDFQIQWLKQELSDPGLFYVIFSHHGLSNEYPGKAILNRAEIREILGQRKTILCMNGHDHGDDCRIIDGIPYFTLNGMSYILHGQKPLYLYEEAIHQQYPELKDMILYEDALHCIVEIENGNINIRGMESDYRKITPEAAGRADRMRDGVSIEPKVSSISLAFSETNSYY